VEIESLELQAHHIFSELTDAELQELIDQSEVGHFKVGQYLIREGEDNPYLYLIREGTASVRSYKVEFARLRPGSLAGEISAAGISQPIADVVVLENVNALMIPAAVVRSLASRHPGFRQSIHDTAMRRVLG